MWVSGMIWRSFVLPQLNWQKMKKLIIQETTNVLTVKRRQNNPSECSPEEKSQIVRRSL